MVLTEAQKRANKKWRESHHGRNYVVNRRSVTLKFINAFSNSEDLIKFEKCIKERKHYLSKIKPVINNYNLFLKGLKDKEYFDDYVVNLKSCLIPENNFQNHWNQIKKIDDDPIILFTDGKLFNLCNDDDLKRFESTFPLTDAELVEFRKIQNKKN